MASPKINTAFEFTVPVFLGRTLVASPAVNAGDVKVSTAAAALGNITTLPISNVFGFKVNLSAGEMNGAYTLIQFASATSPKPWDDFSVLLAMDVRNVDDLAFPATSGRSMVVDAAGLVDANAVKVGPTGAGTAQTAGDIPARLPAALDANGFMKADVEDWKGTTAPANTGDAFARLGAPVGLTHSADVAAVQADTDNIQTRLPAALVGGRMDSSVGAMASGVILSASFAAGAIDSSVIGTTGAQEIADAVLATAVDGSVTLKQILQIIAAAASGKLTGAATTTITIRDVNDTRNCIVATVDASGNRSAVTYTVV